MRTCTKCQEAHPVAFFNRDRTRADGLYPYCKTCSREACRRVYGKYHEKHVALKRRWKDANRDRLRVAGAAYRTEKPEKSREGTANYRARLKRATPPWVAPDMLKNARLFCPAGYEVDHIHPLAGYVSCGLNVPWNLQYLPAAEHRRKARQLPVVEECPGNV